MTTTTGVQILARGAVTEKDQMRAKEAIAKATRKTGAPVLSCCVKLDLSSDPANETPAVAQASVNLNGRPVRCVAAADTMPEAVRLMQERLRHQIEHVSDRLLAKRHRGAESEGPSEWRHGDPPTNRPAYFPRPVENREVLRHKSYALYPMTAVDAAEEMHVLDYDFHLYVDTESGTDSLVARRDGEDVALSLDDSAVPTLNIREATEWLDLTDEPWVFFRERDSRRGSVAYRRYDGHYGIITPAAPPQP